MSEHPMQKRQQIILIALILLSLVPALSLIGQDALDIDSAQYAEIGREMAESNGFLFVRDNGQKYLDKPILTFWIVAASFKAFGENNVAFRLPSLLFALLSLYSIYRITLLRSGRGVRALLASLLYASSPGLLSMLVSPLIDIYLTSFLIFTHHAYYLGRRKNRSWYYLMYLFMGLGFITKGPIAVVIPGLSIGMDLLLRRDWKTILSMKIPQGILITAILPLFWSWVLFQEFSWYGPHFFIIIQSFGRFYSFIYNQRFDPLFFVENFAWAFGLFFVPLLVSVFLSLRHNWKRGNALRSLRQWFASPACREGDFVVPLWLFLILGLISLSRFQLPQYIYWILPAGAIYTAGILEYLLLPAKADASDQGDGQGRGPILPRWAFFVAPVIYGLIVVYVPATAIDFSWPAYLACLLPLLLLPLLRKDVPISLLLPISLGLVGHLFTGLVVYRDLVRYQPASVMAPTIMRLEPDEKILYKFMISNSQRSYAFYAKRLTRDIWNQEAFEADLQRSGSRLLLISGDGLAYFDEVTEGRYALEVLEEYPAYKVSKPKVSFFNRKKRPGLLKKVVLARVSFRSTVH